MYRNDREPLAGHHQIGEALVNDTQLYLPFRVRFMHNRMNCLTKCEVGYFCDRIGHSGVSDIGFRPGSDQCNCVNLTPAEPGQAFSACVGVFNFRSLDIIHRLPAGLLQLAFG
jgi:hypothetical protein